MRYKVQWWYNAIDTWMDTGKYFWFRRFACRYIGKRVIQAFGRSSARKWRVIDGKTNKIIMTVERLPQEGLLVAQRFDG